MRPICIWPKIQKNPRIHSCSKAFWEAYMYLDYFYLFKLCVPVILLERRPSLDCTTSELRMMLIQYWYTLNFQGRSWTMEKALEEEADWPLCALMPCKISMGKQSGTIKVMLLPCQRLPMPSWSITPAPQKILGMKTALVEMSHGAVITEIWPLDRQHIVPYKIPYLRQ